MKKIISICLSIFSIISLKAQDPHFSQFYANPIYLNSSLTGINNQYRVTINHRQQWDNYIGYTTSSIAIDGHLEENSGWGIQYIKDKNLNGLAETEFLTTAFSHRVTLNEQFRIGLGVGLDYYQFSTNQEGLIFGDQLDARDGIVAQTQETFSTNNLHNFDVTTGFTLISDIFVGGLSIKHIGKPLDNISHGSTPNSEGSDYFLPLKMTIHASTNLISKNVLKKPFYLSPNLIYEKQGSFQYLNIGMYYATNNWSMGIWNRIGEAVIFSMSLNIDKFRLGYSYDYSLAKYNPVTGNSSELSLSFDFELPKSKKIKNRYKGKCPDFYKNLL